MGRVSEPAAAKLFQQSAPGPLQLRDICRCRVVSARASQLFVGVGERGVQFGDAQLTHNVLRHGQVTSSEEPWPESRPPG